MATITDSRATDPAFVVERFAAAGDRLEVAGHWRGLRGRRFVRPVLWLHNEESRRRLVAVLDHKPWAADEGAPWLAAFPWDGGELVAERAELEVGRELVVDLPLPGGAAPEPLPAKPRPPSELERVREQLLSATKERRELESALTAATVRAEELTRVRDERDRAREDADRARADGERLVNDEYRQRERAQEAAERASARAREAEEARRLAERQLAAARRAHAELEARAAEHEARVAEHEQRVAALEAELSEARTAPADAGETERLRAQSAAAEEARAAAVEERERLRADLAGAADALGATREERDRLRAELAAATQERTAGADSQMHERELAGAWAERDQLAAELAAARAGRERVEAELVAARADRKRLEREVSSLRDQLERDQTPRRRAIRVAHESESRLAPPSGNALWGVRLVAISLVAILLAAIALLLTNVL
jgi:chromosome segregation ATPase